MYSVSDGRGQSMEEVGRWGPGRPAGTKLKGGIGPVYPSPASDHDRGNIMALYLIWVSESAYHLD